MKFIITAFFTYVTIVIGILIFLTGCANMDHGPLMSDQYREGKMREQREYEIKHADEIREYKKGVGYE